MYAGLDLFALGWALSLGGRLTFLFALLLIVLLDRKAAREERILRARFAAYETYCARTRGSSRSSIEFLCCDQARLIPRAVG
jgi:protein-S-isoprenylcysteine O-methyltransferase Ste14